MNITTELLMSIYIRANQYAISKYGKEPDRVSIDYDGVIVATYIDYCCGESNEESYYISADNLSEDLEKVAKERKIRLEEQRVENERLRKIKDEQEKERAREVRKRQYIELKKEFEKE